MQDMDNGWSSTYDAATRTITFEAAWAGRGWWLGRDLEKMDITLLQSSFE